jgi:hypothetical protein
LAPPNSKQCSPQEAKPQEGKFSHHSEENPLNRKDARKLDLMGL